MKVSELLQILQKVMATYGDLKVTAYGNGPYSSYQVDKKEGEVVLY